MLAFLTDIFNDSALSPHGICLLWRPELIWLHVISDFVIGISYYSIPVVLVYFVAKRRDIAFGWILWMFAAFILACGTTHFFSIWTLWHPDYGIEGLIKLATAAVSVFTALALWPLLPRALALPSPAMLARVNNELSAQIRERDDAFETLRESEERYRLLYETMQRETEERHRVEDALRQSQKMEAVGQLTGGVAHDFNNLLTIMLGNIEAAIATAPQDARDLRRFLASVERAGQRAAHLTHRLLAFSRRQPLVPRNLDINKLVAGMSELLQRTLGEAISIETVFGARIWLVHADSNELESAMLNLVINARDAMPNGGKLTIETANFYLDDDYAATDPEVRPGQYVMLAITDTGIGMSEEVRGRAFDPFFTTKPTGQGSGLGLSMVYGFAKQSGGNVRIYSEPGQGATVKLYLPRIIGEEEQLPMTAGPGAERGARGREVILIVEDEPEVRAYAARVLRLLDYEVLEAGDANAALAILGTQQVDLLFTDIGLPGVSGRELADKGRSLRSTLKVLFTTGYARNAIIHNGIVDPDVNFIPKPFRSDALARKIRQVLDLDPPSGEAG
jgi:signal transduction histidine kinase/ActR/RegA family two-component response regulator